MPDREDLLRAVLTHPREDTPRLAYADWLEEHAEPRACERCKGKGWYSFRGAEFGYDTEDCDDCGATGRVYPDRDRAEFIRVQCELARHPAAVLNPDATYGEYADLRRRERDILTRHGLEWFRPPTTYGIQWGVYVACLPGVAIPYLTVRRGFVESVAVPTLAGLLGEACGRRDEWASGHGHEGPGACPDCHGTGYVGGVLREMFRSQPVEAVTVADRLLVRRAATGTWVWQDAPTFRSVWASLSNPHHPTRYDLPAAVFVAMGDARHALSAALVSLGRAWAGLPPLPAPPRPVGPARGARTEVGGDILTEVER